MLPSFVAFNEITDHLFKLLSYLEIPQNVKKCSPDIETIP